MRTVSILAAPYYHSISSLPAFQAYMKPSLVEAIAYKAIELISIHMQRLNHPDDIHANEIKSISISLNRICKRYPRACDFYMLHSKV